MGTVSHAIGSFFTALPLLGVAIYFFIEDNNDLGRFFSFLAIYVLLTVFYVIRSMFYLKHKATFNEFIYVFLLPIVPVLILLFQKLIIINEDYILSTGNFTTSSFSYTYYISTFDFLLLPFYLFSTFLLFRTFIRYPFIRFRSTREKGEKEKRSSSNLSDRRGKRGQSSKAQNTKR
jgi:ABC-type multidrug transport system permease subunit